MAAPWSGVRSPTAAVDAVPRRALALLAGTGTAQAHRLAHWTRKAGDKAHQHDDRLRILRNCRSLAAISAALTKAGIPHAAFKGPALSQILYGDPAARHAGDLDILVRDVAAARPVFERLGYSFTDPFAGAPASRWWWSNAVYFDHADGTHVELHHQPFASGWLRAELQPDLLARTQTVTIAGQPVPFPASDAVPEHLLLHGSGHGWSRLCWLTDIAQWLAVNPEWDATAMLARARRNGTWRRIMIGLQLAHDHLGARLPRGATPADLAAVRRFTEAFPDAWRDPVAREKPAAIFAFQWRQRERLRDRLRLVRLSLTPTDADVRAMPLPRGLQWLRYVGRPFRMVMGRSRLPARD